MDQRNPHSYYRRPVATCALPNCAYKASTAVDYYNHLVNKHGFPNDEITETYSFDYFVIDSTTDHILFAQVCRLCAKSSGNKGHSETHPSVDESERHLLEHIDVLAYKCSDCSCWFKSFTQAKRHSKNDHNMRNSILNIDSYFGANVDLKNQWTTAVSLINTNLLFDPISQFDEHNSIVDGDEDNIKEIVSSHECEWHSIREIKGLAKKIFLVCGDWQQIGKMISSSSIVSIKKICFEIKNDLAELIMHPKACHSMATLFFNCDEQSWEFLIDLLNKPLIRLQFYDSLEAGNFFRKMMTNESFRYDRFLNLSIAFDISEICDKKAAGLFFTCMAARPGPGALSLAQFAIDKIPVLGNDPHAHNSIRLLIITASKCLTENEYNQVYVSFLQTVSESFDSLITSNFGISLLQAITFYSPSHCHSFLTLVTSYDWIFGKVGDMYRFAEGNHSQLIQSAVCARTPDEVCQLAMDFFSRNYPDPYWLLLKDKVGNNILRRMVGRIGDRKVLEKLATHLSTIYTRLCEVSGYRLNNFKFAKVVVDLTSMRLKMAKEACYNRFH